MTENEARLAQIQHVLNIAASVSDPKNPEVQKYLSNVLLMDPKEILAKLTK